MSKEQGTAEKELKSDIGLLAAMSIVVGVVLGAGAFMKPPAVLAAAGDSSYALAAWLLGGLFSMAGGLTLCELGVMFPRTGGVYVYLEEIFGDKVAFLYGWMIVFLFGPATIGALGGYFSSVFCLLFNVPIQYGGVVAGAALAFVTVVNSISVKAAGRVQMIATACKLLPIALLVLFGLWQGNGQVFSVPSVADGVATSFSVAVLATLFAYDGWAQVASLGGEIKNPSKILPKAIIGGLSFLLIVYMLVNVALLKVIPAAQIVALGHDASTIAAQKLFGLLGGNIISVGIMIAILGGLNGYVMTLSRVLYSMGLSGHMPASNLWSKIDSDSNTPVNAIIFLVFNSFIYNLMFDADKLSNIASFSNWIFYMMTFIAVIIARKTHAHVPRAYKVPLYPFVPLFAICGALYVFYGMLTTAPLYALFSIGLTLTGLPVYYYMTDQTKWPAFLPKLKTKFIVGLSALVILGLLTVSVRVFDTRPEIRVGTEPGSPPFTFEEKGNLTGFDIDLMNTVAYQAGYKVSYRPISLEHLLPAVTQGYVDVAVSAISITPERQEKMIFTEPYLTGGTALLVRQNSNVKIFTDLVGKKVGVHAGSTGENLAMKLSGVSVQAFQSDDDMVRSFNAGSIEAIIHDRPILEYFMSKKMIEQANIVQMLTEERYGIAVSPSNRELFEKLNKALDEITKRGEVDALKKQWFGEK